MIKIIGGGERVPPVKPVRGVDKSPDSTNKKRPDSDTWTPTKGGEKEIIGYDSKGRPIYK